MVITIPIATVFILIELYFLVSFSKPKIQKQVNFILNEIFCEPRAGERLLYAYIFE